ncbi:MAG: hypothetical protein IPL50_10880 [Chitinophagaceae bacterium]|nr:hypothetical protein [Chitinophagaceae bacterium]
MKKAYSGRRSFGGKPAGICIKGWHAFKQLSQAINIQNIPVLDVNKRPKESLSEDFEGIIQNDLENCFFMYTTILLRQVWLHLLSRYFLLDQLVNVLIHYDKKFFLS